MKKQIPNHKDYEIHLDIENGQPRVYSTINKKYMDGYLEPTGYRTYRLQRDDTKKKHTYQLGRLVGLCFIDNPNNLAEIDHIDRNRDNNKPSNLRWTNRSYNCHNKNIIGFTYFKNKYIVRITKDRITRYIGTYLNKEEALNAYKIASKVLYKYNSIESN